MASDRDESPLASASLSSAAVIVLDSLIAVTGSCPLCGLPRFFRMTDIDAMHFRITKRWPNKGGASVRQTRSAFPAC
jgi:hypothetical protein